MTETPESAGGSADNFKFGIERIRIGHGEMLDIRGPGSATVVVGANNVGKSTLLVQIREILMSPSLVRSGTPEVVTEVSPPWGGIDSDFEAWIRANSHIEPGPAGGPQHVRRPNLNPEAISSMIGLRRTPTPGRLVNWLVNHQTPGSSVTNMMPAVRMAQAGDAPAHPLQVLYKDRSKLDQLTRVVKRLFGFDLFLDPVGVNLMFRMGLPDAQPYLISNFDPQYDAAVAALPQVLSQGDGIKAALGQLVTLISDFYPLVLLDEPEAHLHPPQARIVGVEIGKQARDNGSQVIVSTHDTNIVRGIIESEAPVTILHLKRAGDTASAQVLNPEDVAELWKDPILRYSNALDGLFHSAVIICEGERDAHFYNATIDYVQSLATTEQPAHNLMFIGTSGKTNMARFVTSLHKLGVRTVSCPDLDILDNQLVLKTLVEAHGGNWADLEDDYRSATNEFRQPPNTPTLAEVKTKLDEILAGAASADSKLTESVATAVKETVKLPSNRWNLLKQFGFAAFNQDKGAANRLLDKLGQLGIVAVRVGVLEKFVTTVSPPKGPDFLPIAFAEMAHNQSPATDHASRLLRAAGIAS